MPGGCVNHQKHLGHGGFLLNHALDLAELIHQTGLILQATRSIDQHRADTLSLSGLHRVESNRGRISTFLFAAHGLHAHAVTPSRQLFGSRSTEGISRAQQKRISVRNHHTGDLTDRRGLPYAVHADHKHHAGVTVGALGL